MTSAEKWSLGIVLTFIGGIILYIVGVGQGWWRNIFSPVVTESDYAKCVALNKSKRDGEPCTNCVPEGSLIPNFRGAIQNGECVRIAVQSEILKPRVYRLKVKSPAGAYAYSMQNGNFVAKQGSPTFPVDSNIIAVQYVDKPAPYYRTKQGYWIDAKDVTFLG